MKNKESEDSGVATLAKYLEQQMSSHPYYTIDCDDERKELFAAGRAFNERVANSILAHGNDRGGLPALCSILLDGELRHYRRWENYGGLGDQYNAHSGHWDNGQGLFVVTLQTVQERRMRSTDKRKFTVPLNLVEAIVLPAPLAEAVKYLFPSKERIVRSYAEYSNHLRCFNVVFDHHANKEKKKGEL